MWESKVPNGSGGGFVNDSGWKKRFTEVPLPSLFPLLSPVKNFFSAPPSLLASGGEDGGAEFLHRGNGEEKGLGTLIFC